MVIEWIILEEDLKRKEILKHVIVVDLVTMDPGINQKAAEDLMNMEEKTDKKIEIIETIGLL